MIPNQARRCRLANEVRQKEAAGRRKERRYPKETRLRLAGGASCGYRRMSRSGFGKGKPIREKRQGEGNDAMGERWDVEVGLNQSKSIPNSKRLLGAKTGIRWLSWTTDTGRDEEEHFVGGGEKMKGGSPYRGKPVYFVLGVPLLRVPKLINAVHFIYLPLHMEPWLALSSSPKGGKIHPGPAKGTFFFFFSPFLSTRGKQTIIILIRNMTPAESNRLYFQYPDSPVVKLHSSTYYRHSKHLGGPEPGRERDDWIAHARSYQIQRIPLAPQAHRRRYLNFDSSVSILRTEHAVRICFIRFDIVFLGRCGTDSYSAPYECCVGTPRTLYKVTPIIWPWVLHSYPQEPTSILEAERQLDSRRPAAIEQPTPNEDWLALADTVSRLTDKQLESSMNLGLASSEPATRGAEQHKLPTPINSRTIFNMTIYLVFDRARPADRQPEQHPAVQSFYISNNRPASYSVSPLPPCRIFSLLQAFSGGIPAIHVEHSAIIVPCLFKDVPSVSEEMR
ncbi:hypothetical protein CCUS01_13533 [Colletotrichum cuscutae]|uniref:Uncharacterized protein n=1 Tax=Colletotrichum cuscutae TaxID=1209917 RepID=A0AAI9YBQ3_9PEZI|nr:hypothetical protein CCUS01_13533 [Colletotrichum cuscutae]